MTRSGYPAIQLMKRNLRVASRNTPALAFTLFQPVLWMVLFSQNFRQLTGYTAFRQLGFTSYLPFFVPSIMVLTVLNASALSGMAMVTDVGSGVMDKLVISPISRWSILLGRILADALSMLVQSLVVLAIAFAMGARAEGGVGGVLLVLLLTILLGICAAAFSDFIALRTRSSQLTMIINGISVLPLLLLSPAFFPQQLQAGWLHVVEWFNPVAYVVKTGQQLMNLGYDWGQLWATLGVLALTALLCFTASISAFRRATGSSGKNASGGLAALFARIAAAHSQSHDSPATDSADQQTLQPH